MGHDDLFEYHDKHRKHGGYGYNSHHRDNYDYVGRYSEYMHKKNQYGYYYLNKIWSNKKLRTIFVILAIILVFIVVVLIVALIPLILKLVKYITQNGLQGVFDSITSFLNKLWQGTRK